MNVLVLISFILLLVSAFFALVGSIGIIRMPDVYNRIHSETLCVVGGSILGFIGIVIFGLAHPDLSNIAFSLKALIIAGFLFVTNPVGSHAIARAAHKSKDKLYPGTRVDRLEEVEG